MSHQSDLIATDIEAYLAEHENKDLLRFLTCGSVDDGKSTLIGRLLHDSHMVYEDQLAAVQKDSTTQGSTGGELDLSLLMDGLKAEREQGITIDVAYRYFSTQRRKFIIADTPGHVQYTRNMVTGASTAQLAIVMVDARHGVLPQTKRHSTIAHLLGIRHVVVAINKMDLVDWSQESFERIRKEYEVFAEGIGATFDAYFLPMSALTGDNVVNASDEMPWFDGVPLMEHLETVDVTADKNFEHLRLPVQLVSRPDLDFRGFQGTIASGVLRPGDDVTVLPSGVSSTVDRIVEFDGDLAVAGPGMAVTVTLTDEIDVSRGDVFVHDPTSMQRSHRIDAMLVWMAETPMRSGHSYLLQSTAGLSNATIPSVRYQLDMDTLEHTEDGDALELNDIARVAVSVDRELLFDAYDTNRETGSFILVDRLTNATVGAGMIVGASSAWDAEAVSTLTRAVSLVTPTERATRFAQQPVTVLLTGLTGAGKSTIAKALERRLFDSGRVTVRLDGQNVRQGVSRDLGFTAPERSENVRRVAEVARLVNEQGIIAIAAMTAPDAADRERARQVVGAERFIEVYIDTDVAVCRERDPGGLYSAIEGGAIIDLPGVTSPYEAPTNPDMTTSDAEQSADAAADEIIAVLRERGMLSGGAPAPVDAPPGAGL